ncbi:MAG: hypothetical protein FJ026_10145, partial [Chloroflexi bacterium]|nr:hypothetical protein [Chloroflexota bacterium]
GAFWIPALAEAIEEADAFLLLLSSRDPGPWQLPEYYEALNRKVKQPNFPLVPLLLPDVEPRMPFLKQLHWLQAPDPTALDVLERLVCALHGESLEPAAEPWRTLNPYKGLPAFTETDADFFFGREALTRNLLECLRHGEHFLMLVGNSGVGKSSLVQAGVIAALRHERWPDRPTEPWPHDLRDSRSWLFLKLTPGEQPLYALARAFVSQWTEPEDPQRARWSKEWAETLQKDADLADLLEATADVFRERYGSPAPRRFVLMVDQGEELYTHSPVDQAHRFTELLAQGSQRTDVLILGTLRSDYYGRLQQDKVLFPVATRVDVPPLWENDLRRAVVEPAQALEANFEDAQMAADIAAEAAREPGALPLLSYLMEDMWKRMQRRGDGVLRWQDYRALGGVRGVLARRAENYVDTCSEAGQETLRRLFTLRLVHVPIEGEAVRRRARRSECTDAEWEQVQALAGSYWRLLVTSQEEGEPTAEVAHDVLLRAWDRLAKWTRDESKFLEWKGRLDALLEEWRKGRGMLLRNTPLSEAEHWLTERGGDLNPEECAFIQASKDTREREQQHELEQERKRAAERTRFAIRLGWLTIVLLVLTVFAVVKSKEAQHNATIAHARQLTAQASLSVNEDTERAILLALEAITTTYKVDGSYLPEAEGALRQAIWAGPERIALKGHTDPVLAVAFSPDGKRVATASLDCTARLWDTVTVTGQSVLTFTGHTGPISAVAFSPNGNLLATASDDNTARLWDTATGQSVLTLTGHTDPVVAVVFSPNGKLLATASNDNTARLWNMTTGQAVFTLTCHTGPVVAVAFSPNGKLLATASEDNKAWLWDAATGQQMVPLTGHIGTVSAVAFSPDGKRVATAGGDSTARLWDAVTGWPVSTLSDHSAPVSTVVFSPDGKLVATASEDTTARLWPGNLEVLYPLVERRIARKLTLEERQQYLGEPLKFCVLPR